MEAASSAAASATNMATDLENNFGAQTLTISGIATENVTMGTGSSADEIAEAVNAVADKTGVYADANTKATLSGVSTGQVSFALMGTNTEAVTVSASIETENLDNLAIAINKQAGNTGITANLSDDKKSIVLQQSDGADIKIADFANSAATECNHGYCRF